MPPFNSSCLRSRNGKNDPAKYMQGRHLLGTGIRMALEGCSSGAQSNELNGVYSTNGSQIDFLACDLVAVDT